MYILFELYIVLLWNKYKEMCIYVLILQNLYYDV
jgi:hypothetical protein